MQSVRTLSVFPNPSSGPFSVRLSGAGGDNVLIVVKDILGRELYSSVILLAGDNEVIAIDPTGKLPAGVYSVVASSASRIYQKKIVIQ
jgi:hypothetical protein